MAKFTKITGNTYPVRDQLKALGGKWNAAERCWEVPKDQAEQAWALVGGKPTPQTTVEKTPKRAAEKALAKTPAKVTEKTPEQVAEEYYLPGPAIRVGELRGMPVFAKYGPGAFAIDQELNPLSIGFQQDGTVTLAKVNSWKQDLLTEAEVAPLREPVRRAIVTTKATKDASERATWEVLGELRGRPVRAAGSGRNWGLLWVGEEKDFYLEWGKTKGEERVHLGNCGEALSLEESESLRPAFSTLEAREAAFQAERERKLAAWRSAQVAEYRAADRWPLEQGEGYGGRPFRVGETFRTEKSLSERGYPEFLTVLEASQEYYCEDGMSFGVGAERGHIFGATCRAATEEELRPIRSRIEEKARSKQAAKDLEAVAERVRKGERPEGRNRPEGEVVSAGDGEPAYGGGQWFVIGADWIWFVENNGGDGDDWSPNNVTTGGAGAIGWRVPAEAGLAEQIRELAATAGYTCGNKN